MSRTTFPLFTLVALLSSGPALAQHESTRLDPVDVRSARAAPRVDVSLACPSYASTLQNELQGRLPEVHRVMEQRVQFNLRDGGVRDVALPGLPFEFRQQVRKAVRRMDCTADGKPQQNYAFLLVLLPEGHPGGAQLAARELDGSTLAAAAAQ
jgi:hypothetical protein